MDTPPAQAEPTPAPPVPDLAHAPLPTDAPPSPGSSTTTQLTQPAPTETAPAATVGEMDEEAYRAAIEQIRNEPPPAQQGTPAAPVETPAVSPTDVAPPANETLEPPEDPAAPTDDVAAPERIRLTGLNEEDRAMTAAAVLLAKAQKISVAEAMARMAPPPPAAPVEPAQVEPAPVQHEDPAAIVARIAELKAARKVAGDAADTVRMAEISDEIDDARDAHVAAVSAQIDRAQAHNAAVQESRGRARSLYPSVKDPASPLAVKWGEIHDRLKAAGDPLASGSVPEAPLVITQMAARELGIAPAAPVVLKASPSVTPTPPPAVRSVQPAPGSARSSAPSNPIGQLDTAVASIKSTDDYEALLEQIGVR